MSTPGWVTTVTIHVWPDGDLVEHELSPTCPCSPVETEERTPGGVLTWLFTHSSLDGRELSEPDHVPAAVAADPEV